MRIVGLVAATTMGVGLTGVSGVSATPIGATVIDEAAAAVSSITDARAARRAGRVRSTNTTGTNTNTRGTNAAGTKTNR
jgi:hypothetical protein